MPASSSWRGLVPQLFLVIILPLTLLLLGITFGSLSLHQNAMRALVAERDERAARSYARSLDEQIRHRADEIRGLALRLENGTPQQMAQILATSAYLRSDFDGGLAYFSASGQVEVATEDWAWWQQVREKLLPTLQSALAQPVPGSPVSVVFIHPARREYDLLVVAATPEREHLAAGVYAVRDLIQASLGEVSAPTILWIVDRDGALIYSSGNVPLGESLQSHPGVAEALSGKSGTTYLQVGSNEHVVAYSPLASMGWALLTEEPWEMVSNPTLRTTQVAPLVLVPVLILAMVALWFGIRQIVQPLQQLEARAAELAWGNFQAIEQPVQGIPEIRRLQSELIHLAHKVRAAQQGLRGYIGAMTLAQEEERRRLSHELHDDTLQALIALKQRVQLVQMRLKDEDGAQALAEIIALTEQTITNLRRLTRDLRPIYLEDLGLVTALKMLAQDASQSMGIPVDFECLGEEKRLPAAVELALYRMAQEGLNNIARHAQASAAWVKMVFTPEETVLEVADNGIGFQVPKSPAEFAPSGHFGLLGLYERAELIGAKLRIQSATGKGTRLSIHLPEPVR